jgi:hypothetical protein
MFPHFPDHFLGILSIQTNYGNRLGTRGIVSPAQSKGGDVSPMFSKHATNVSDDPWPVLISPQKLGCGRLDNLESQVGSFPLELLDR